MSLVLLCATLFCLFLGGSFVVVFRNLSRDGRRLPAENDWIQHISQERYRPMERLLNEAEYGFLQSHPAFSPKMLRRFRAQRVRAFRGYMGSLAVDFSRVCNALKALMVESTQDRADLAGVLIKQRIAFAVHFMLAQYRLTLHAWGLGTVNAGKLVAALESMRMELHLMMAAIEPAAG